MVDEIQKETLIAKIKAETDINCEAYEGIKHEIALYISPDDLKKVINILRDDFGCDHLSTITAQQRENQTGEIELIYHFWKGKGISLMMRLPLEDPQVESLVSLIPGADFYEREVAELYGVSFSGREATPKLLLPDAWDQGPPFLRCEVADE